MVYYIPKKNSSPLREKAHFWELKAFEALQVGALLRASDYQDYAELYKRGAYEKLELLPSPTI